MSEKPTENAKEMGMCPHGNFPASCPICAKEKSETETAHEVETHITERLQKEVSPGEETKNLLHADTVDSAMDQVRKDWERQKTLQTEKLHALLLTQDEEGAVMKTLGDKAFEKKEFTDQENTIVLVGTRHSWEATEPDKVYQELTASRPDVFMHEGKNIRELFPDMSDQEIRALDPTNVIRQHQEQAYLAWRAFSDGIKTQSWDMPMHKQFIEIMKLKDEAGLAKHKANSIQAWVASMALSKFYEKGEKPSVEILKQILPSVLSPQEQDLLLEAGIDVEPNSLLASLATVSGKTTEELQNRFDDPQQRKEDYGMLRGLLEPRKASGIMGPTNEVLADMNRLRDQNAIDLLAETKHKHAKIAFTAGASHVLILEPAVRELYNT